jgi:hypothetical protein
MLSRVSLFSQEAMAISSRGLRIGMMQPQGAAFRTPSFETVDIRTTGIGRTCPLMLGLRIIWYHHEYLLGE